MTTIPLPLSRSTGLFAAGLTLLVIALTLHSDIAWPWSLGAIVAMLVWSLTTWRRYIRRRPRHLIVETDGGLFCSLANDRGFAVVRVLPGIIQPSLVSARLDGGDGESADLFVPRDALPEEMHWRLRRALLGFRHTQAEDLLGT